MGQVLVSWPCCFGSESAIHVNADDCIAPVQVYRHHRRRPYTLVHVSVSVWVLLGTIDLRFPSLSLRSFLRSHLHNLLHLRERALAILVGRAGGRTQGGKLACPPCVAGGCLGGQPGVWLPGCPPQLACERVRPSLFLNSKVPHCAQPAPSAFCFPRTSRHF